MEKPVIPLRPIRNPRLHAIIPLVLLGIVMLPCSYFCAIMTIALSGPRVAQNLAPPVYPGAVEISHERVTLGNTGFGDLRHFVTPDNSDEVYGYMREHIPEIEMVEIEGKGRVYRSYLEDRSWWGQKVAEYNCSSLYCKTFGAYFYPSFTLTFYPDPDNPDGTRIEYEFHYPRP